MLLIKDPINPATQALSASDIHQHIKTLAINLGFAEFGIAQPDLTQAGKRLNEWLQAGYHGQMQYMQRHGSKRYTPHELVAGTVRVISVGMHYMSEQGQASSTLEQPDKAYIARYALGRDYHKLMRKRLAKLAEQIKSLINPLGYRVFVDSAPVMEKPLAVQAGLGWQGKNTLLINRHRGSWLFLGEIFIDAPLPVDEPYAKDHCGRCTRCMDVCPTQAFPEPYVLDAKKCIAYLTIEHKGSIPEAIRPLMGNRVFGCDDCQWVCPYNQQVPITQEADFAPRHGLDNADLVDLFMWTAEVFEARTQGSPIRRAGYHGWLRNLAVGLGNGPATPEAIQALEYRQTHESALVREHVEWALAQLLSR